MGWATRLAGALCLAGAIAASAGGAAAKPALTVKEPAIWSVQKPNGATITFFGSVHLLPDGDDWRTRALIAAYEAADVVVLETDLSVMNAGEMQSYLAQHSMNPPGVTLSKLLSAEQKATVSKAAEAVRTSFRGMEGFRPWFAALNLSVSNAMTRGFDPENGVDKRIEADARADGKAVGYFETARAQLDLFIDLPEDEQINFLVLGAQEIIDRPRELDDLIAAWADGDVEEIDALMNRGLEGSPRLAKALLADRNARWVKVIRDFFLQDRNSYLIVVGAAHLVGDDSVIAMLRDAGVEVTGP